MKIITIQQQNRQTTQESDLSKVPFLNGMDADGNPVKITPESLQVTQNEFDQQVSSHLSNIQQQVVENTNNISIFQKLLGLYSDRTPITLTASQTGKAIVPDGARSEYGHIAAMTGASVSVEYKVTRGDMLLIKPGRTSNDLFTVAQVVTSADGTKTFQKVMSLNEAAEVPQDGYLRFLVMPSDMTIVITYFSGESDYDQTVRVMRCGAFATISTQVGNIYADLHQNYMRVGGFYGNTGVAYAQSVMLPASADIKELQKATELFPAARPLNDANSLLNGTLYPTAEGFAPHTKLPDGAKSQISFESVGGDVLGGNQMVTLVFAANGGTKYTVDGNVVNITYPSGANINYNINRVDAYVANHVYMSLFAIKSDVDIRPSFGCIDINGNDFSSRLYIGAVADYALYTPIFSAKDGAKYSLFRLGKAISEVANASVKDFSLLDLTTLFPTPSGQTFVANLTNNQASAVAVAQKLGYFCFLTK